MATGEVGKVGVAIDTLDDMRRLLAGIPLGEVSTSMTINATAVLLLLYEAVADEQGVPRRHPGTVQNDILKEYIARGHLHLPATGLDASGDRPLRLLQRPAATVEHHLDQWLPHP